MYYTGFTDLYSLYNIGEELPLPPPPRPHLTKAFYFACAQVKLDIESGDGNKHPEFEKPDAR